jgi:hypothetical protein
LLLVAISAMLRTTPKPERTFIALLLFLLRAVTLGPGRIAFNDAQRADFRRQTVSIEARRLDKKVAIAERTSSSQWPRSYRPGAVQTVRAQATAAR